MWDWALGVAGMAAFLFLAEAWRLHTAWRHPNKSFGVPWLVALALGLFVVALILQFVMPADGIKVHL